MAYTIEQLTKMGAVPVTNASTATSSYTLEQLQAMGAIPVQAEQEIATKPKGQYSGGELDPFSKAVRGVFKGAVTDPFKAMVVRPAQQTGEALGALGVAAFGTEEQKNRAQQYLSQDRPSPIPGINVEGVKTGVAGAKQVAGQGLEAATDIASLALGGQAASAFKPATFSRGAVQGAVQGAKFGGLFGAGGSAARELQAGGTAEQVVTEGATGGITGAAVGGILGGLFGGITGALRGRSIRRQELADLVAKGELSNKKLARYDPTTLKKDPKSVEALRQGIDEGSLASIKTMSPEDKADAIKMFDLAEKASQNKRQIYRPFDLVGENVIEPADTLSDMLKENVSELDKVAKSLKGKQAIGLDALKQQTIEDLSNIGVREPPIPGVLEIRNFPWGTGTKYYQQHELVAAGFKTQATALQDKINFSGSQLEGLGKNEQVINNVFNRINSARDAYDVHQLKRYIDSNVEYGEAAEGLVGQAEKLIKGWRHAADQMLDQQFPVYNEVNTKIADAMGILEQLNTVLGNRFKLAEPLAEVRAGQVSSRILTNSPNRGDILRVLDNLQTVAKKYGYEGKKDIINQVIFADMLEDVFGTQATRSLGGRFERGLDKTLIGAGKSLRGTGGLIDLGIRGATALAEAGRGVNADAKILALKALLGI